MIIIMVKLHHDECGNNLELKSCINGTCNTNIGIVVIT